MKKKLLTVWSSPKKEEMYLYTDRLEGLKRVPTELLKMFGTPKEVMGLPLSEDKNLGRADAKKVLSEIVEKGYYLQMPPVRDDYMLDLYKDTSAKYTDIL
ncbi:YcgL domain-containing protein [Oceaniserpentilla sp. 4NH20-0058]|uniref:YcgL domain-containing protein n=1 Tax=Oceaniserpentilla sp. 4NH20-0058 TaxID=3127660 RepID=UPI003340A7CE